MKNYSQRNEQEFILAACPGADGRFLDIGAFSAETFSNTRALYERGWSGVLIEPSPGPFRNIAQVYVNAPSVTLINAAVGFHEGVMEMWVTDDATSTLDEATYQKWRGYVNYTGKIEVPVITLEPIFAQHGTFDFISIDTEGTSVDLLHRIFALGHRPRCICVEHDSREGEILSEATALGYSCVLHNGENVVLVKQ